MSKNLGDNDLKMLARRYVEIKGEKLEKEANSQVVKSLKQPERPNVKKKVTQIRRFAWIAAAAIFVFVISGIMVNYFTPEIPSVNKSPFDSNVELSWKAPEVTLLGTRFEIKDETVDNGHVVYTIEDFYQDNATITVMPLKEVSFEGMNYMYINGKIVYYKTDSAYNMFLFAEGDSAIELTCKYSTSTLEDLYKAIKVNI